MKKLIYFIIIVVLAGSIASCSNKLCPAYGSYPNRQVEFIGDSREIFREVLQSERWEILETKLQTYTLHYERKLVRYRQDRFQF